MGVLRWIAEYTLNIDGKENGINKRSNATPQRAKKVFFGSLLIASARITTIVKIKMTPEKLICNKLIVTFRSLASTKQWTVNAICAMLGNMDAESGMSPGS